MPYDLAELRAAWARQDAERAAVLPRASAPLPAATSAAFVAAFEARSERMRQDVAEAEMFDGFAHANGRVAASLRAYQADVDALREQHKGA